MACSTTFSGRGGICSTGAPDGGTYTRTFAGRYTSAPSGCGNGLISPRDAAGVVQTALGWWQSDVKVTYIGDCGVVAETGFDCVNGGCVGKSTYNTPGKYSTLVACQSGCAKDSNCTGECVSAEQIAQLNQLIGQVKGKYCG